MDAPAGAAATAAVAVEGEDVGEGGRAADGKAASESERPPARSRAAISEAGLCWDPVSPRGLAERSTATDSSKSSEYERSSLCDAPARPRSGPPRSSLVTEATLSSMDALGGSAGPEEPQSGRSASEKVRTLAAAAPRTGAEMGSVTTRVPGGGEQMKEWGATEGEDECGRSRGRGRTTDPFRNVCGDGAAR